MSTKQPEALADLIDRLRSLPASHTPDGWPAVRTREITALLDELRRLHAENEALQTGYDAARLEIESLQAALAGYVQSGKDWAARTRVLEDANGELRARVNELEVQLESIGAGGVEPLRKRCLHQISEPGQAQPRPVAAQSKFINDDKWGQCSVEHAQLVLAKPGSWPGYEARMLYAAPQPAAQALDAETNLGELDDIAKQFASSYASPHHFTMGVTGLRKVVAAIAAQQVAQVPDATAALPARWTTTI